MWDFQKISFHAVKSVLFCFNLFFAFTGLILLSIGFLIKGYFTKYEPFLDDKYFSASSLLIASGTIIFIIAFLGCCGAIRENRCMVIAYSIFLSAIMILEFSSGVTGYVLTSETNELLNDKLNQSMYRYTSSYDIALLWDTVQADFQCCGLNNFTDWHHVFNNDSLPVSCCAFNHGTLDVFSCNATSRTLYHGSCKDELAVQIKDNTLLLGGVAFGIIGMQFLGILFSCYLSKAIKNSNYETV